MAGIWRLACDRGQQVWNYVKGADAKAAAGAGADADLKFDKKVNPNSADKIYRAQALADNKFNPKAVPKVAIASEDAAVQQASNTALKAMHFYSHLQAPDGHWPGDYGGPMFLMPGLIITCAVTNTPIAPEKRAEMVRYLFNHQHADGGWGIHIEEKSTMFGTVLNYVSLRLLGQDKAEPRLAKAREFLLAQGGAMYVPSWGKFWLAALGVYEWDGFNSIMPELWLLPKVLPVHPWRWWCHCRMVYLPMAYAYGHRIAADPKRLPIVAELRNELYTTPYDQINWKAQRNKIAKIDLYTPQTYILKALNMCTNLYERFAPRVFRKKALDFILSYVHAEDDQTKYVDIGPVNKVMNMLCVWHGSGPASAEFKSHVARLDDYLWLAEDGMKMQGYNGSQLWDTAFAVQAYTENPAFAPAFSRTISQVYDYLEISQVREDVKDRVKFFRHISQGGWPFSTRDHGWPISDCTAEGVKATLAIVHSGVVDTGALKPAQVIDANRLADAINVILSFQNADGGWATYENTRGPAWLEWINPAEVFGGIMIDYSYVECTSACVQALSKFKKHFPNSPRLKEIDLAIANGVKCIRKMQRPNGSWYGSWAVCFTYGTWFGVEGLLEAGVPASDPAIQRACKWLASTQFADPADAKAKGWGESFQSCVTKEYVPHDTPQVVNTAWACLTLMAADYPDRALIQNGIDLLVARQQGTGDWDQEAISGVFNGNCMITYTAYRNVFPIWALSRYVKKYGAMAVAKPVAAAAAAAK